MLFRHVRRLPESSLKDSFIEGRRQALEDYLRNLLRSVACTATANPYVLQFLGLMPQEAPAPTLEGESLWNLFLHRPLAGAFFYLSPLPLALVARWKIQIGSSQAVGQGWLTASRLCCLDTERVLDAVLAEQNYAPAHRDERVFATHQGDGGKRARALPGLHGIYGRQTPHPHPCCDRRTALVVARGHLEAPLHGLQRHVSSRNELVVFGFCPTNRDGQAGREWNRAAPGGQNQLQHPAL